MTGLFLEGCSSHNADAFLHSNELVHSQIVKRIDLTAGPANLNGLDSLVLTDSEMDTKIILRVIAAATAHLINLATVRGHALNARSDPISIRLDANRLDLDPVV